jgi:hypothetical protein
MLSYAKVTNKRRQHDFRGKAVTASKIPQHGYSKYFSTVT